MFFLFLCKNKGSRRCLHADSVKHCVTVTGSSLKRKSVPSASSCPMCITDAAKYKMHH